MHRRIVAAAMAGVLSFAAAGPLHAAPRGLFHNSAASAPHAAKMISFTVRNDSKSPLVLQAGDHQVSIDPGKTAKLKLAEGAVVSTVSATENRPAGSVLTTVSKALDGNTLAVS